MTDEEFLLQLKKVNESQQDHNDFYDLAEKYGFCVPWCKREDCECKLDITS